MQLRLFWNIDEVSLDFIIIFRRIHAVITSISFSFLSSFFDFDAIFAKFALSP